MLPFRFAHEGAGEHYVRCCLRCCAREGAGEHYVRCCRFVLRAGALASNTCGAACFWNAREGAGKHNVRCCLCVREGADKHNVRCCLSVRARVLANTTYGAAISSFARGRWHAQRSVLPFLLLFWPSVVGFESPPPEALGLREGCVCRCCCGSSCFGRCPPDARRRRGGLNAGTAFFLISNSSCSPFV